MVIQFFTLLWEKIRYYGFGRKAFMFTPLDFLPIEYVPDAFAQIQSIPSSDDGPQNYMDTKFYRHIREQL